MHLTSSSEKLWKEICVRDDWREEQSQPLQLVAFHIVKKCRVDGRNWNRPSYLTPSGIVSKEERKRRRKRDILHGVLTWVIEMRQGDHSLERVYWRMGQRDKVTWQLHALNLLPYGSGVPSSIQITEYYMVLSTLILCFSLITSTQEGRYNSVFE